MMNRSYGSARSSDEILLWIEIGQPDEKRIKKACSRSRHVLIYCHQHRAATVWWKQIAERLKRFDQLSVFKLPDGIGAQLATLARRNMDLQCTIQDGEIWLSNETDCINFALEQLR